MRLHQVACFIPICFCSFATQHQNLKVRAFLFIACYCLGSGMLQAQLAELNVTAKKYEINGQKEIPIGMFGVHSTSLSPERVSKWGVELVRGIEAGPSGVPSLPGRNNTFPVNIKRTIDCYYDRYQPAWIIRNPGGFTADLENLAERYANAAGSSFPHVLEFWNEPFLNWASRPAVNYDNRWYDTTQAVVGAPVKRPGSQENMPHLVWNYTRWFRQIQPPTITDPVNFYVQLANNWTALNNLPIGGTLTVGSRTFQAINSWLARDTTQASYYSSLANGWMYDKMYRIFASKIKEVNPNVKVLSGWGIQLHQDNYRPWRTLYRLSLDSNHALIDGIHEHHYGGDTRWIASGYEVAHAYAHQKYGKRLKFYNTEAGGFLDPQIPGNVTPGPPSGGVQQQARSGMTYTLRDILFLLRHSPDKAEARSAHEAHLYGAGDGFALEMMKHLRGELVWTESTQDNLWVVASRRQDTLAVLCFNDNNSATNAVLKIELPQGQLLESGSMTFVKDSTDGTNMAWVRSNLEVSGQQWRDTIAFTAKSARAFLFQTSGTAAMQETVKGEQFFGDKTLLSIPPNTSDTIHVNIAAEAFQNMKSARLKMLVQNVPTLATLNFNGTDVPYRQTGFFTYLPLDTTLISSRNTLVFRAGSTALSLQMVSVEVFDGQVNPVTALPAKPVQLVQDAPFRVFPNPTKEAFQLKIFEPATVNQITLLDASGKICHQSLVEAESASVLFGAELQAGAYQLQVQYLQQGNMKIYTQNLLKQ